MRRQSATPVAVPSELPINASVKSPSIQLLEIFTSLEAPSNSTPKGEEWRDHFIMNEQDILCKVKEI